MVVRRERVWLRPVSFSRYQYLMTTRSIPWTRDDLARTLGPHAVIGMIHLKPLPGAPLWGGSMRRILDAAVADAFAIAGGGADALLVENFGDRPFPKTVGPETVAAMTAVICEMRREIDLPFGVNVLRNDPAAALAIAAATGACFIRVNVHTGAMLTDQGVIEGRADETLRSRARLAPEVAVFADHLVKHAVPVAALDPLQAAKDLRSRALADAVLVTGRSTGATADPESLRALREILDAPLVVASGVTAENAHTWRDLADGIIVGTSIKKGGEVDAPVEEERVREVVRGFKGRREGEK